MYRNLKPTSITAGILVVPDPDFNTELNEYRNPGTRENLYRLANL